MLVPPLLVCRCSDGTLPLWQALGSSEYTLSCHSSPSSGSLHTAKPGPLPGSELWSLRWSTQPSPTIADTNLRLGSAGQWCRNFMHVALYFAFCNPGYCALLLDSRTPPLSRLISLLVRGLHRAGNFPFYTTPSPGCRSHSTSILSLLLVPSGYVEIFSLFFLVMLHCLLALNSLKGDWTWATMALKVSSPNHWIAREFHVEVFWPFWKSKSSAGVLCELFHLQICF